MMNPEDLKMSLVQSVPFCKLFFLDPSSSSIRHEENDGKAGRDKELHLPPGLESPKNHVSRTLSKSKSQGRVATNNEALKNIRKRVPAHVDLSPIKGSPPVSPAAQARKNTASHNGRQQQQRVPLGPIHSRDKTPASYSSSPQD
ncbi:hypothetical protein BT96DRAFT_1009778 [Gymnopus androsaceus JB14]|uniref:Uncharacterized protein n=1 Tax=Gymnopus androsaceus JB14 TaxID=1447944 RepID=A0A6A4GBR9_9AGAR|nr:hypothetical protein BT96DRAFT_1009778 [Gymnopus androsaceus JB14]